MLATCPSEFEVKLERRGEPRGVGFFGGLELPEVVTLLVVETR